MSIVTTPGALPNEWTLVGRLSAILSLTAHDQQSIRVHFGSETAPAANAAYVVMQNHLPRPVMEPYHEDPAVWIMSDDTDIVETTVVRAEAENRIVAILPTHGPLAGGRVGSIYATSLFADVKVINDTHSLADMIRMEVVSGELPPGLTLSHMSGDKAIYRIAGTPTTEGEYFFTVSVRFDAYLADAFELSKGEFASGTYSIKIGAAS